MARRKSFSAPTLSELVCEAGRGAHGEKLIAIVEREIKISDTAMLKLTFSHVHAREGERLRRMRLGRLLHWIRQGSVAPGVTVEENKLYGQIEKARRVN